MISRPLSTALFHSEKKLRGASHHAIFSSLANRFHQPRILTNNCFTSTQRALSIGRMLDMGGAPSGFTRKNKTRINASKNLQVKAVLFEFHVLTTALDQKESTSSTTQLEPTTTTTEDSAPKLGQVLPDTTMIQNLANLLNVDLTGNDAKTNMANALPAQEDDLSLLTGETDKHATSTPQPPRKPSGGVHSTDVRSKYADKLKQRGLGGVSGVDLAKQQVQDTLSKGDAGGHWAARKMALSSSSPQQHSKWMAQSGTGRLLQYLTQRSVQIALLPSSNNSDYNPEEGQRMRDLQKQLHHEVVIQVLMPDARLGASSNMAQALSQLQLQPIHAMVVSNSDATFRAAKELGLVTCRIRPDQARRGNVSTQYTVSSIEQVRTAVDDANGISFNAVLKGR